MYSGTTFMDEASQQETMYLPKDIGVNENLTSALVVIRSLQNTTGSVPYGTLSRVLF